MHRVSGVLSQRQLAMLRSARRSTLLVRPESQGARHPLCKVGTPRCGVRGARHLLRFFYGLDPDNVLGHRSTMSLPANRHGEIRVLNAAGEVEESITFDERANRQRV